MSRSSYGFWSRAVHRMALAHPAVAEASFDMERALHRARAGDVTDKPHVFVTGLARAGTTILMRQLYQTGAYRSLTYRDMPFVLAPNIWGGISGLSRKDMAARERAHGDTILVDFDSPEALEEVFWRVICGDTYIRKDRLIPMSMDQEHEKAFRDYVALLLKDHPGKLYLSKNNNNILRLASLARCFPNAVVVIPFRDPLQHAYSLMRQHRNFSDQYKGERFAQSYMTWLVHHEFGLDHRPFVFDEAAFNATTRWSPEKDLGYWLQLWIDVYRFITANAPESSVLLSYDRLCDETETVWSSLCSRLNLPQQSPSEQFRGSHQHIDLDVPDALLDEAHVLHDQLLGSAY